MTTPHDGMNPIVHKRIHIGRSQKTPFIAIPIEFSIKAMNLVTQRMRGLSYDHH